MPLHSDQARSLARKAARYLLRTPRNPFNENRPNSARSELTTKRAMSCGLHALACRLRLFSLLYVAFGFNDLAMSLNKAGLAGFDEG